MLKPNAQATGAPAAAADAAGATMDADVAMGEEGGDDGMSAEVLDKISSMSKTLSKARKKRVSKPEGLAAADAVAGFKETGSFTGLCGALGCLESRNWCSRSVCCCWDACLLLLV
jgi:hypothetical protein